jgi:hypothetical protein
MTQPFLLPWVRVDPMSVGCALENVTTILLRLEQSPSNQFAFPEPIAAAMELVGLCRDVEFIDPLRSTNRLAASVARVAHAVAAADRLGVFARQSANVEFFANPVDQAGIPSAHRRP